MVSGLSFLLFELIGKKVKVSKSPNKDLQELEGKILFETKNTFLVQLDGGERKLIPKKGNWFFFPEADVEVKGSLIEVRPEDRTKRLYKKLVS